MREAVALMGGYGITEDCPLLFHKWNDSQLEATYEGPECVQRRQLSITMASDIFLAYVDNYIAEMERLAATNPETGAATVAAGFLALWQHTLVFLSDNKDADGKKPLGPEILPAPLLPGEEVQEGDADRRRVRQQDHQRREEESQTPNMVRHSDSDRQPSGAAPDESTSTRAPPVRRFSCPPPQGHGRPGAISIRHPQLLPEADLVRRTAAHRHAR